nr:serine:threonine protein phosphatase 6 [Hymenolepis microstoma]
MVTYNETDLEKASLLDDPDITLELVLLHPEFTDAYREYDYKLIEYLCQTQNILRMIEFIRQGPDLSKSPDNQYDLACRVEFLFQQEVSSVREAFLSNTVTLDALYSILEDDKSSSRLSTLTLTCRIFSTVYRDVAFLQFLACKPELVSTFFRLIEYDCVRDLFVSFFHIYGSSAFALFQSLDNQRFIQRLLKRFLSEETKESCANTDQKTLIGHFLCQIMFVMRQLSQTDDGLTAQPTNPLLAPLESEQTIVQVVEAIVTLSPQNSEMLPHFLNFLRHLFFTVVEFDIGVGVPTLPNHQTRESNDFESKGISPRSIGLLHPILPYLKSYLHFEGSTYDAEDNASFSRTRLPLQPLGQVRIHVARFLCHLLFHCRGEDGAEIVERIAELDFVGDLTDLFFAFKWNSLMHATLHFFTQMILRRGFNYSPIAPSTILNAGVNNSNASLSANSAKNGNEQVVDESEVKPPYKSPNHLNPYAKIVHQLLVKHNFLNRLLTAWNLDKSKKGQPGYRRPGYLGHLQEIAVHLSSYLLPDEFDHLGISVRDYDMAIVEDENRHWQLLQDRRQRRRSEKTRQLESDGKVFLGFTVDELLSDEEDESSNPRVVLRMQLLKDLPPQDLANFAEFVSGELRQVVSVSNVEHLRDLKSALVSAPKPSRFILTDSAPSIEAATEAYEKYKNEPLVGTFNEVFGRDENDFDPLVKCVEDRVENMFRGLFASLVLPEDTSTFQPRESLPRPIQPTMRSHRLSSRSSPKSGDPNSNGVPNPLQDPGRRKRLVTPFDLEDGEVKF